MALNQDLRATTQQKTSLIYLKRGFALSSGFTSGLIASVFTQPLEVIKSMLIVNPTANPYLNNSNSLKSFLETIRFTYQYQNKGVRNFFQGAMLAGFRQAIGFGSYVMFLEEFNKIFINSNFKYMGYSASALCAKTMAVCICSPIMILKTRLELLTNQNLSVKITAKQILYEFRENPQFLLKQMNVYLQREILFSATHYSLYKYLQDKSTPESKFLAPYLAAILATTITHPLEVIRNRMMSIQGQLNEIHQYQNIKTACVKIMKYDGLLGFMQGLLPRLLRKPINSGITWTLYELQKQQEKITN